MARKMMGGINKQKKNLGLYAPPTSSEDAMKLPGLLDNSPMRAAPERAMQENSRALSATDNMELAKKTKRPQNLFV